MAHQALDSRSQLLTLPIEWIFKIPEASKPPKAPARGEQTVDGSMSMLNINQDQAKLTEIHGQPESEFPFRVPSGQIISYPR
jgi:hypothetical protein